MVTEALEPEEHAPQVAAAAIDVQIEEVAEAIHAVAHAHIAEVISMTRVAHAEPARSPVAALERFLRKVQARRTQVMAQSVA